jgi:hypothetical protein
VSSAGGSASGGATMSPIGGSAGGGGRGNLGLGFGDVKGQR